MPSSRTEFLGGLNEAEQAMRVLENYIETSYRNANLSDAAALLKMTPTSLCRWIQKHYHTTFKDLLTEKRFSVATQLLLTTDLPISQIIESVGYENSSYFHKVFRKRYGKTPKALRRQPRDGSAG